MSRSSSRPHRLSIHRVAASSPPDPCEREADFFAAALLMPAALFRKATRAAGDGFPAIERLAGQCVTSITATAIRFAEFSESAVAVIVSSNEAVDFCLSFPVLQDLNGVTWMRQATLFQEAAPHEVQPGPAEYCQWRAEGRLLNA